MGIFLNKRKSRDLLYELQMLFVDKDLAFTFASGAECPLICAMS